MQKMDHVSDCARMWEGGSSRMRKTTVGIMAGLLLYSMAWGGEAHANADAIRCQAAKLKSAAKYHRCRIDVVARSIKRGTDADFTRCQAKFVDDWSKIETKNECPENDGLEVDTRVVIDAADIVTIIAGGTAALCGDGITEGAEVCDGLDLGTATCESLGFASGTLLCGAGCVPDVSGCVLQTVSAACGNAVVDAGEDCDLNDLGGASCGDLGFFGSGLACGPGCQFDTSTCRQERYEDTGRGTVIDHLMSLEWQKTDNAAGVTDKDNLYTWTSDGLFSEIPNGTVFTEFLRGLNAPAGPGTDDPSENIDVGCYASHCDWRLPQIYELETLIDGGFSACAGNPCVDEVIFGPMNADVAYWSSTTYSVSPVSTYVVDFGLGFVNSSGRKDFTLSARAVRDY